MDLLPVELIPGRNSETVIWVQGGVHGDEAEGILALRRYCEFARDNPPPVTIKVLCPANYSAFTSSSRVALEDNLDLNRSFPGDPDGMPTEQLAAAMWSEIKQCQGVVDIHSSSETLIGAPHAIFQTGHAASHRIARSASRASGLPIQWASSGGWLAGSLMHVAMAANIPACLLDIGSSRPWERPPAFSSILTPALDAYADMANSEPRSLTMTDSASDDKDKSIEITDPSWVTAPRSGWIVDIRRPSDVVEPGEILAVVWDEELGEESSITWDGPEPGLVVTVRVRRDVPADAPLLSIAGLPRADPGHIPSATKD